MKLTDTMTTRRWLPPVIAAIALIAGVLLGSYLTAARERVPPGPGAAVPSPVTRAEPQGGNEVSFPHGFAPVVRRAAPTVVNIASSKIVRSVEEHPAGPFSNDPFFRQFFGDQFERQPQVPPERREQSLGSGVIVSPDGTILTNNHVIEGANDVKVFLADKREFAAHVVGTDPRTDVAVLKIAAQHLPALPFGDSSKVQVGDLALAIGDPFGIGQTVTMGIISATGRGNLGIEDYEDFIQTDAAINPGNSGGALIGVEGQLIGINTAILSGGTKGNQGIGFAVPTNMARYVMDQILKHGKVVRGSLGVAIQDLTPALARAFQVNPARGVLVANVTPGSPAAAAGLAHGDVLIALNDEAILDSRGLRLKVAQMAPGTQVRLKFLRDGREREATATLAAMPSAPKPSAEQSQRSSALEGVQVDNLTPQIAGQLGLPAQTRGVVVTQVQPGTPAADAGLRGGDVIQEVNHQPVADVAGFQRAGRPAANGVVLLRVNRGGNTLYLAIAPRQ
jgi:serine protease Do